jgi:hypothetical protein
MDGEKDELWEIRGKAPNTKSVKIKPIRFGVSLTALTAICKIAFLELILLEPWHRNCAAAGAGLRSCPATWRCHMTAGGGS